VATFVVSHCESEFLKVIEIVYGICKLLPRAHICLGSFEEAKRLIQTNTVKLKNATIQILPDELCLGTLAHSQITPSELEDALYQQLKVSPACIRVVEKEQIWLRFSGLDQVKIVASHSPVKIKGMLYFIDNPWSTLLKEPIKYVLESEIKLPPIQRSMSLHNVQNTLNAQERAFRAREQTRKKLKSIVSNLKIG
jgi:hypothetical protein